MSELNYAKLQEYLGLVESELFKLESCAEGKVNAQKTTGEALDHYHEQELEIYDLMTGIAYMLNTADDLAKKHQDFTEKYGT